MDSGQVSNGESELGQSPRGRHRLLMIEDDRSIAQMYTLRLVQDGWMVDVATDGEAGLASALSEPPALVLLDVMLPGIDGLEVLARLRANDTTRDVPVLILSNSAGIGGKEEQARRLGVLDWLTKSSTSPGVLAARIRSHLD